MRNKINLLEHRMGQDADIYHKYAYTYDLFSRAEDASGTIANYLKQKLKGKSVLDIGCGTGKYLKELAPYVAQYTGLDCSLDQLALAKQKSQPYSNVSLIHNMAWNTELSSCSMDSVIACWILESIRDQQNQNQVLKEMNRVLKKEGSFYVIENTGDSEFDQIIKREPDISTTAQTREWLLSNGFNQVQNIHSYFQFSSLKEARNVFSTIWGKEIADRVQNEKIEHNISIYEKVNS
jgi:ubiquinone/menaquinone biosynthesis C-methylase UbiE